MRLVWRIRRKTLYVRFGHWLVACSTDNTLTDINTYAMHSGLGGDIGTTGNTQLRCRHSEHWCMMQQY